MSVFLWTAGILIGIGLIYGLGTYHEYIHLENAVKKFFETKETATKDEMLELLNNLENDL